LTFEVWAAQFFDAEVPLTGDSDGDGLSEIAEYLLGTDPSSRASNRFFDLRRVEDGFMLPLPDLPERIDATLGAESSDDLDDWSPVSFERRLEGLFFESTEGRSFLRLTFSLNDPLEGR